MNATIYVQYGSTDLGESQFSFNFVTYSSFLAALTGNSHSSGDPVAAAAVNALNSFDTGSYGSYMVAVNSALARALGFPSGYGVTVSGAGCSSPGTGSCYDGIIIVSNDTPLYYRTGSEAYDAYDFYAVVEHETDEVLGTASCIDTPKSGLANGCVFGKVTNVLSPVDLFRYQSAGDLVLISSTPGAYFSYNGGQTNGAGAYKKVYNTLSNGDDYADFLSSQPFCQTQQSIQDAEGCPGSDHGLDITNDGGAEINILNAIGYRLAPQTPAPSISNVLNAATGQSTIASGTYVAIFGTNLSTNANGRTWLGPDFIRNPDGTFNLPTALDGTTVTVNNIPAYVEYISPSQLNIIAPPGLTPGSNAPVVVNLNGQPSVKFNIAIQSLAPSFFTFGPPASEPGKYLAAEHLSGALLGKVDLFPGTSSTFTTPAKPGETIQLFGTGFGLTSPPIAPGIVTDKLYNLTPTPTATVGTMNAAVAFAGLIPSLSQVYQFDITIPSNAPNGDLPLVVTVNGVKSVSGLITVQGP